MEATYGISNAGVLGFPRRSEHLTPDDVEVDNLMAVSVRFGKLSLNWANARYSTTIRAMSSGELYATGNHSAGQTASRVGRGCLLGSGRQHNWVQFAKPSSGLPYEIFVLWARSGRNLRGTLKPGCDKIAWTPVFSPACFADDKPSTLDLRYYDSNQGSGRFVARPRVRPSSPRSRSKPYRRHLPFIRPDASLPMFTW